MKDKFYSKQAKNAVTRFLSDQNISWSAELQDNGRWDVKAPIASKAPEMLAILKRIIDPDEIIDLEGIQDSARHIINEINKI